jgi:hypothetical protein
MDTSTVYAIVCLLAVVPIAIVGSYIYQKRLYGDEIVKQLPLSNLISLALLLFGLVGLSSLILLIARSNNETSLLILWPVGLAAFWIALLRSLWRRPTISSIVVELEPPFRVPNWIIGIFAGGGILSVLLSLTSGGASALNVLAGLSMLSLSVWHYLQGRRKTRFAETGIYIGDADIKWERVKAFHWLAGRSADTTMLHLQIRGLFSLLSTIILRIPAQHKDAINDLLTRHVSN